MSYGGDEQCKPISTAAYVSTLIGIVITIAIFSITDFSSWNHLAVLSLAYVPITCCILIGVGIPYGWKYYKREREYQNIRNQVRNQP
jgi:ABC-type proline/glycine betaine transport system permease subunit